jgi:hypothetical protein
MQLHTIGIDLGKTVFQLVGLNPRGEVFLFSQVHEQLVSAAYLWRDTESRIGLYSAGHPPLLRCCDGKLERVESNGLLFGVMADPDYPVCRLAIRSGEVFCSTRMA